MYKVLQITLLILIVFIMNVSFKAQAVVQIKEIPLRDFFKNPEKTGYQISPDGKYLSYLAPYENRLNIFIEDLQTGETKRVTNATDRDLYNYFWKGNNTVLYVKDNGGDENFQLYASNINTGVPKNLTPFDSVRVGITDDLPEIDDYILIEMNKRNKEIFDVYRINVNTGEMTMVAENPGNISGWVTDHEGKVRVATTTDGVNTSLLYRETESEPFKEILKTNFKETLAPLFFTFDNQNIYAASNLGRDKAAIVKYDIKNGKEIEELYSHPEVDVENLNYSRKRKVLTSIPYTTWKRQVHFLDDRTKGVYEDLYSQLGTNYEVVIVDLTKDESKYLVRTYSDRSLGSFYLYDYETKNLKELADVSPWLNENDLAEMKPIQYTSRDGLTINGYLTLPKGVDPKNLPVVVNPHGGPWYRDVWTFNPEVQFLANRGFAVLQVNFRGSTGYGRKFWEDSFKQWGLKMQDDVTDGVNWLIEQGIADPSRVAIYGGSYGGYTALAGLTFTPDVYSAGVDYVGVSNLFTFMETIPPYWKPYLEMMYEMVGNPKTDSAQFIATSPVFHADKIKAPLFIAQGKNDPRVKKSESDQMIEAMKKRGIEVEYMVKDNEGHGFHNEENRFDFYETMEKFLKKHLNKSN
ncbi:MAG TPA: S9 family peptidase [Ignavibacteria bacterium]|nr:S9 family peptidase [Ignavibacteria bacterium]